MLASTIITSAIQVTADIICFTAAAFCAVSQNLTKQRFFVFYGLAFLILAASDFYFDYTFRIEHEDITKSIGWALTLSVLLFQFVQAYNWRLLISNTGNYFFSLLPAILFTAGLIISLIYYFSTTQSFSGTVMMGQGFANIFDVLAWFFALACFIRARSITIVLLTLGSLLITSANVTSCNLYMLDPSKVAGSLWVEHTWTLGAIIMMIGFLFCLKKRPLVLYEAKSFQTHCRVLFSTGFFILFALGFFFLSRTPDFVQTTLWKAPILLVMAFAIAGFLARVWTRVFHKEMMPTGLYK